MLDRFSSLNFDIYNSARAVTLYLKASTLQAAEIVLLEELRPRLAGMDMLDVGVGAGRTTAFFAPLVRSYLGIDFAPAMVDACKARFPGMRFAVADAARLETLADCSLDFILFSFNGLDCMTAENREKALGEFMRLLRPGGHLVFSGHNVNFLPAFTRGFRSGMSIHPIRMLRAMKSYLRFLIFNRSVTYADDLKTALVFERHLGFEFPLLFVRPDYQVADLARLGWQSIRAFASDDGRVLDGPVELRGVQTPWVYYHCCKPA